MATTQDDVVWMLDVMDGLGAHLVVAGGWGIDALIGRQTREHRDLDVLVPESFVARLVDALVDASFSITTDWLPVRVELSARGRIDTSTSTRRSMTDATAGGSTASTASASRAHGRR